MASAQGHRHVSFLGQRSIQSAPNFLVVSDVRQHLFEKGSFLLPLERWQSKMMPGVRMRSICGRCILGTDH